MQKALYKLHDLWYNNRKERKGILPPTPRKLQHKEDAT